MKKTISSTHPELAAQLVDKSLASQLTYGSRKKVEWECDKGHRWLADCNQRTARPYPKGCAVCGNRKIVKGVNDLATTHPQVINRWSKKNTLQPTQVSAGSAKKAWFNCPVGHEYQAAIHNVALYGTGCTRCSRPGTRKHNPVMLMSDWDIDKNGSAFPKEISVYSPNRYWWRCDNGHSWEAPVVNRFKGYGCPYCAGHRPYPGENDIATTHPEIAERWSDKNTFSPSDVTLLTDQKIWLKCPTGKHPDYYAGRSKDSGRSDCPRCSKAGTSKGEKAMAEYIESLGFDIVRNDRTIIKPQELDVYIPSEQVAFEYNGEYWHSKHPEGYHEGKTLVCARAGVTLIHIWEKEWLKDLEEARALIRKTLNVYQRPSTRSIKPAS